MHIYAAPLNSIIPLLISSLPLAAGAYDDRCKANSEKKQIPRVSFVSAYPPWGPMQKNKVRYQMDPYLVSPDPRVHANGIILLSSLPPPMPTSDLQGTTAIPSPNRRAASPPPLPLASTTKNGCRRADALRGCQPMQGPPAISSRTDVDVPHLRLPSLSPFMGAGRQMQGPTAISSQTDTCCASRLDKDQSLSRTRNPHAVCSTTLNIYRRGGGPSPVSFEFRNFPQLFSSPANFFILVFPPSRHSLVSWTTMHTGDTIREINVN
jgi:hypothetical protein